MTDLSNEPKDQEKIVVVRSPISEFPKIVIFLVSLFLFIYLTPKYPGSIQYINIGVLWGSEFLLGVPFFGLFPIVFFCWIVHGLYDECYIICDDHVLEVSGRVSFSVKSIHLNYPDIRGIEIQKSLFQRLFNIGNLKISASVHSPIEITMQGISNPSYWKDVIEGRLKNFLTAEKKTADRKS